MAITHSISFLAVTYGDKSFTWSSGRNLATITDSSNNDSISYTYNRYGYRTSKTVNGVATNFIVDENGTVVAQKTGNDILYFEYDNYGSPLGFVYNGVQYLYITNIRNDVIAITDTTGTVVAGYTYGDWGECTVDSTSTNLALANLNPLRYRGYYYDNETGYYYLQSRYYDPSICRFINSDLPEYAQMQKDDYAGTNLFAYCCNEPVNNSDYTGHSIGVIVAVEAAKIIAQLLLIIGISLTINYIFSNTDFKPAISAIQDLCKDYALKKQTAFESIKIYVKVSYNYVKTKVASKTKAASRAISIAIADAKVKTIVSRAKKSTYWIAYIGKGYVTLGESISRNKAISLLKCGVSIFSISKYNARNIASAAILGKTPYGPEKHGESGYFWHYHITKSRNGSHSFYL